MPLAVKRLASTGIGTSRVQVGSYTAPASTATVVIGLAVANTTGSTVTATVETSSDGVTFVRYGSAVQIPTGAFFEFVESKLALSAGDRVYVTSNTAASLDVTMSLTEIT